MIINDDFNNYKKYKIPKADLILTDIPYNIGTDAYASNPRWWRNGNVAEGKSEKANSKFFNGDGEFQLEKFLDFCSNNLKEDGSVIVFCSHFQQFQIISYMKKYGFKKYIPLVFCKKNSAEVLKVNMRIVGACEYGLQLIKGKLPKFYNNKKMIKNWFMFDTDFFTGKKIHPNQKCDSILETFITLFTKEGDVIIDPCAGSGSTYYMSKKLNRQFYGFEILSEYYNKIKEWEKENE